MALRTEKLSVLVQAHAHPDFESKDVFQLGTESVVTSPPSPTWISSTMATQLPSPPESPRSSRMPNDSRTRKLSRFWTRSKSSLRSPVKTSESDLFGDFPDSSDPFDVLPEEIFRGVVRQLKALDHSTYAAHRETCALHDLYSLCLTSRSCYRGFGPLIYETVDFVGIDAADREKKKAKYKMTNRLQSLRRTLRKNHELGARVKKLKVPPLPREITPGSPDYNQFVDVFSSVIMACPNLERMCGFRSDYNHEYDKLSYALGSRRKLREHVWWISGSKRARPRIRERKTERGSLFTQGGLQPEEISMFLHNHSRWIRLETLVLHSDQNGRLDHEVFVGVFSQLPSLRRVCLSNFEASDFNDSTLSTLPGLTSLRLQNLPGVTERGISLLASSSSARTLRHLSLLHLEIDSLSAITKLFAGLGRLKRFTFVQNASPELPSDTLMMQPVMGSSSIEDLHWEVLNVGGANDHLASSILNGGFPQLRKLRAPSDHDGILQSVCKPRAQICLPDERYGLVHEIDGRQSTRPLLQTSVSQPQLPCSPSSSSFSALSPTSPTFPSISPTSPTFSTYKSPISPTMATTSNSLSLFPSITSPRNNVAGRREKSQCVAQRSLQAARLAAQSRIETARQHPWFTVIIEDASAATPEVMGKGGTRDSFLGGLERISAGTMSETIGTDIRSRRISGTKPSLKITPPRTSTSVYAPSSPTATSPSSSTNSSRETPLSTQLPPLPIATTTIRKVHHIPSYLGQLNAKVHYVLDPDVEGSDTAVADLPALLDRMGDESDGPDTDEGEGERGVARRGRRRRANKPTPLVVRKDQHHQISVPASAPAQQTVFATAPPVPPLPHPLPSPTKQTGSSFREKWKQRTRSRGRAQSTGRDSGLG